MMLTVQERIRAAREFYDCRCQLSPEQIEWIVARSSQAMNGRVLFFGLGFDSRMWDKIADVTFIEDDPYWHQNITFQTGDRSLQSHLVRYDTVAENWFEELADRKLNELPISIEQARFDVVIVDGPKGTPHGRVSSVLHASRRVADDGCVFIDDLDRDRDYQVAVSVLGTPTKIHRSQRSHIGFWQK